MSHDLNICGGYVQKGIDICVNTLPVHITLSVNRQQMPLLPVRALYATFSVIRASVTVGQACLILGDFSCSVEYISRYYVPRTSFEAEARNTLPHTA